MIQLFLRSRDFCESRGKGFLRVGWHTVHWTSYWKFVPCLLIVGMTVILSCQPQLLHWQLKGIRLMPCGFLLQIFLRFCTVKTNTYNMACKSWSVAKKFQVDNLFIHKYMRKPSKNMFTASKAKVISVFDGISSHTMPISGTTSCTCKPKTTNNTY